MGCEATNSNESWDTGYHDVSPSIRTWDTNRDTIPPSGRMSTLEGPGGDELHWFPSLVLDPLDSLRTQ